MNDEEYKNRAVEAMKKFFAGRPGRGSRSKKLNKCQTEDKSNGKNAFIGQESGKTTDLKSIAQLWD